MYYLTNDKRVRAEAFPFPPTKPDASHPRRRRFRRAEPGPSAPTARPRPADKKRVIRLSQRPQTGGWDAQPPLPAAQCSSRLQHGMETGAGNGDRAQGLCEGGVLSGTARPSSTEGGDPCEGGKRSERAAHSAETLGFEDGHGEERVPPAGGVSLTVAALPSHPPPSTPRKREVWVPVRTILTSRSLKERGRTCARGRCTHQVEKGNVRPQKDMRGDESRSRGRGKTRLRWGIGQRAGKAPGGAARERGTAIRVLLVCENRQLPRRAHKGNKTNRFASVSSMRGGEANSRLRTASVRRGHLLGAIRRQRAPLIPHPPSPRSRPDNGQMTREGEARGGGGGAKGNNPAVEEGAGNNQKQLRKQANTRLDHAHQRRDLGDATDYTDSKRDAPSLTSLRYTAPAAKAQTGRSGSVSSVFLPWSDNAGVVLEALFSPPPEGGDGGSHSSTLFHTFRRGSQATSPAHCLLRSDPLQLPLPVLASAGSSPPATSKTFEAHNGQHDLARIMSYNLPPASIVQAWHIRTTVFFRARHKVWLTRLHAVLQCNELVGRKGSPPRALLQVGAFPHHACVPDLQSARRTHYLEINSPGFASDVADLVSSILLTRTARLLIAEKCINPTSALGEWEIVVRRLEPRAGAPFSSSHFRGRVRRGRETKTSNGEARARECRTGTGQRYLSCARAAQAGNVAPPSGRDLCATIRKRAIKVSQKTPSRFERGQRALSRPAAPTLRGHPTGDPRTRSACMCALDAYEEVHEEVMGEVGRRYPGRHRATEVVEGAETTVRSSGQRAGRRRVALVSESLAVVILHGFAYAGRGKMRRWSRGWQRQDHRAVCTSAAARYLDLRIPHRALPPTVPQRLCLRQRRRGVLSIGCAGHHPAFLGPGAALPLLLPPPFSQPSCTPPCSTTAPTPGCGCCGRETDTHTAAPRTPKTAVCHDSGADRLRREITPLRLLQLLQQDSAGARAMAFRVVCASLCSGGRGWRPVREGGQRWAARAATEFEEGARGRPSTCTPRALAVKAPKNGAEQTERFPHWQGQGNISRGGSSERRLAVLRVSMPVKHSLQTDR
ncbi:hypothetical protein C8R47DRAFT_1083216 [Mycena vitilis]|nr:hypothetical protein C8R47DRAFT_1083216 [Mycena vitilis]